LSFVDDSPKRFELEMYPSEKDKIKIDTILKNFSQNKKIILIAPGSKWFTKRWPEEYFKTLIQNLVKRNDLLIVITGGKEEKETKDTYSHNDLFKLRAKIMKIPLTL